MSWSCQLCYYLAPGISWWPLVIIIIINLTTTGEHKACRMCIGHKAWNSSVLKLILQTSEHSLSFVILVCWYFVVIENDNDDDNDEVVIMSCNFALWLSTVYIVSSSFLCICPIKCGILVQLLDRVGLLKAPVGRSLGLGSNYSRRLHGSIIFRSLRTDAVCWCWRLVSSAESKWRRVLQYAMHWWPPTNVRITSKNWGFKIFSLVK